MSENKKRLVVIGATGFVGKRFCQKIIDNNHSGRLKVTFTARNKSKFNEFFPSLITSDEFKFIELDNYDQKAVNEVIKDQDIVCNFAGPFAKYAPNVVAACAKFGVHYLDITGEINFIREMIEKYDDQAKDSGACLIPFSGFDSVPSDLGVYLIKKKINELHNEDLQYAHIIYKAKGGINGGTIASAFESLNTISNDDLKNLHYLCPKEREFYPPLEEHSRKDMNGYYVAPFFMEPINNKVIFRTKYLADHVGYAKNFLYEESMYTTAKFSYVSSQIIQKSLDFSEVIKKSKKLSTIARKILPKPGQGPNNKAIENGFFNAQIIGISTSGKTETIKLRASGDPGNKATVNLILLCLECLLQENKPKAGFQTPVSAFGDNILKNLNNFELSIKE